MFHATVATTMMWLVNDQNLPTQMLNCDANRVRSHINESTAFTCAKCGLHAPAIRFHEPNASDADALIQKFNNIAAIRAAKNLAERRATEEEINTLRSELLSDSFQQSIRNILNVAQAAIEAGMDKNCVCCPNGGTRSTITIHMPLDKGQPWELWLRGENRKLLVVGDGVVEHRRFVDRAGGVTTEAIEMDVAPLRNFMREWVRFQDAFYQTMDRYVQ